jgi:PAS domain S-box-containing protein
VTANPAAQKILGVTLAQLQGQTAVNSPWRTIHEDGSDFPIREHPAQLALRSGEVVQEVVMGVYNPQTAATTWLAITALPQFKQPGEPPYAVISTFEDITARKRAEQAQAESYAKLEKLFEILPVGISVLDRENKVVKQNLALGKILDLSAEGLERGDYRQRRYLHPDGTPMAADEFASQRVAQGEPQALDVETGIIKENGELTWVNVSAVAVPFSDWGVVVVTSDHTAHKQAELALRESQERLATIFERSPLAIGISRLSDNKFMEVNPAMLSLTGYTRAEMLGHTAEELSLWVDPQQRQRMLGLLATGEQIYNFEATNRRKTGELLNILISAQIIEINHEKHLLGQIIDITERKHAEQALRESEARYRLIAANTADVIWVLDPAKGKFTYVSPSVEKLRGYTPAEVLAQPVSASLTPESLQLVNARITTTLSELIARGSGTRVSLSEVDQPCKDGSIVHTEVTTSYVFNERGEVEIVGVSRDITARKQTEQALQAQQHFISSVVNTTPAIIYVYDLETQSNVFTNNGISHLLGYPSGQASALGKELFNRMIHPEDLAQVVAFQSQILAAPDGMILKNEHRAQHQNGSWHVLRTYETPFLRNVDGSLKQKIGVAIDITEQRRASDELRASHARLSELSRQLVQVQESERRAIGRELHDQIGQMLTAIKITLEIASQLPPEAATQKNQQAQAIASDLLKRISQLSLELRPPMLDDLGLVPALLWHLTQFQEHSGLRVDFKHSGAEDLRFNLEIETTAYRLIQEALTNVARHARATLVRLKVQVREAGMDLEIEDNGQGFNTEAALAQNRGVSSMHERARLLGGALQIASQAGHGTKITVQLPFKELPR